MSESTRPASSPIAGAARFTTQSAVAGIATHAAMKFVPPEIMPNVEFLIFAAVGAGVAYLGKVLRDRGLVLGKVV